MLRKEVYVMKRKISSTDTMTTELHKIIFLFFLTAFPTGSRIFSLPCRQRQCLAAQRVIREIISLQCDKIEQQHLFCHSNKYNKLYCFFYYISSRFSGSGCASARHPLLAGLQQKNGNSRADRVSQNIQAGR
ncbi:hypothetical protein GCAAIG_13715 [Candidatus Electronema halotolerans]